MLTPAFLDRLTLLTVGPLLRGRENNTIGEDAIGQVFRILCDIVKNDVVERTAKRLVILNSSGRKVLIQCASDPDIVIREELQTDLYRNLVAIEVKGGKDFANIHNRIGEAEKSHQKARAQGYSECWTVVNVDRMDEEMARTESPTTDRFFRISDLLDTRSQEYTLFHSLILSSVGIR